jgi:hypothetical protein
MMWGVGCDSDFGYGGWCGSDVDVSVGGYDDAAVVAAEVLAAAAADGVGNVGIVGIVGGC